MRITAVIFWIVIACALVLTATALIGLSVSSSYHKMAALGDQLHALKSSAFFIALLTAIVMSVLWITRRPLSQRTYIFGLVIAGVTCALPLLPRVDSGYTQTAFLEDQKYEIPWQFDPVVDEDEPGGTYFRVRTGSDSFVQSYQSLSATISLVKSTDFDLGRGGPAPDETCTSTEYRFICEWAEGDFVYRVSGDLDLQPENMTAFMPRAAAFLDGFMVE